MLIRKVPFIHAFKFFTFQKMLRTPGKARRIKYPYLTREEREEEKKRSINFFEIKSADSTEWARWYLDMSVEDEMRAQKITFIPCIKLSLKTSLNSMLTGEQRVARLGTRVEISPPVYPPTSPTCFRKQTLTPPPIPGWHGSLNFPDEHPVVIYKRRTDVWLFCLKELKRGGEQKKKRILRRKKEKLLHG